MKNVAMKNVAAGPNRALGRSQPFPGNPGINVAVGLLQPQS
jgi:hypothetical protein